MSHVLWECSAQCSSRAGFIKKLQELLEDDMKTLNRYNYI